MTPAEFNFCAPALRLAIMAARPDYRVRAYRSTFMPRLTVALRKKPWVRCSVIAYHTGPENISLRTENTKRKLNLSKRTNGGSDITFDWLDLNFADPDMVKKLVDRIAAHLDIKYPVVLSVRRLHTRSTSLQPGQIYWDWG